MNNPASIPKPQPNDARKLVQGLKVSDKESDFENVKKEFVQLGDFIFRPTEVDWFYLAPGPEMEDGKIPDKTIVYCKGQTASLDDEDHKLFDFLVQYFKPQPMTL